MVGFASTDDYDVEPGGIRPDDEPTSNLTDTDPGVTRAINVAVVLVLVLAVVVRLWGMWR